MSEDILRAEHVSRRFGSLVAVSEVDLVLKAGSVHSVIGPNGAGKTTLFNLLSGEMRPSSGHIVFDDKQIDRLGPHQRARLGISRSFQITRLFGSLTVLQNVRAGMRPKGHGSVYNFWGPDRWTRSSGDAEWDILDRVGLADEADTVASELSHGRQRLLDVAVALASRPRVLLLDEPCAGMGVEDIDAMTSLLRDLSSDHTILLVEHHVDLVMDVSDVVTVLNQGQVLVEGTPAEVRRHPGVRDAYLGVRP